MPDKVDLIGEEELMPGKKWLVYRNQRTGQLSKVPREIMDNPETGNLMMNHMSGYANTPDGSAPQHANPNAEYKVQGVMADTQRMAPDPSKPWVPPGKDYVPTGGGRETAVPQSPMEVIQMLRNQLTGTPVTSSNIPYSADPKTRLYELAEEESDIRGIPGSQPALDDLRRRKLSIHQGGV